MKGDDLWQARHAEVADQQRAIQKLVDEVAENSDRPREEIERWIKGMVPGTLAIAAGIPDAARFHAMADEVDDSHDHDELHAAGALLASDAIYATTEPYVARWLEGLAKLHGMAP